MRELIGIYGESEENNGFRFSLFTPRSVERRNRWIIAEGQSMVAQLSGAQRQSGVFRKNARQYEILKAVEDPFNGRLYSCCVAIRQLYKSNMYYVLFPESSFV